MWGTLVHFENLVVIPNCGVEVLECLEVLRPGNKILETALSGCECEVFLFRMFTVGFRFSLENVPSCKNEGVCLDEISLAVESDVGIVSVVVQLSHLGHELGAVKAHAAGIQGI